MAHSSSSPRTLLLLPLVLLTVVLLEEIAWYLLRIRIHSVPLRVAARMAMNGAAFAFAAARIEPWMRGRFQALRSRSRRHLGGLGPGAFYVGAYGVLFVAFYLLETRGPRVFVP